MLTQADYEALANWRHALRRFMAFSTAAAQDAGLPAQQHQALLVIKAHTDARAVSVGLLAERLLIAPHTATELAGRLADAGLISRMTDPKDRRSHTLALTAKAEDLLGSLSRAHLAEIKEISPMLIDALRRLDERG